MEDDEYLHAEADGYIRLLAHAWAGDPQKVEWVAQHDPQINLDTLAAAFMGVALKGVGKTRRNQLSKRQVSSLYERAYNLSRALPFYAWRNFVNNVTAGR
jgi:hypothetical protein